MPVAEYYLAFAVESPFCIDCHFKYLLDKADDGYLDKKDADFGQA